MTCHILEEKMCMEIMEPMEVIYIISCFVGPQGKNGKNGGKFTIRVPVGTLVY